MKYQNILRAIGYNGPSDEKVFDVLRNEDKTKLKSSNNLQVDTNINFQQSKPSHSVLKRIKTEIETAENSSGTEENEERDADFEDSTIHDERMDLNVLKRKYGY